MPRAARCWSRRRSTGLRRLAGSAEPEDGDVLDVGAEAILTLEGLLQPVERLVVELLHRAALLADQVVVRIAGGPLVRQLAGAHVGFADEVQFLEDRHR